MKIPTWVPALATMSVLTACDDEVVPPQTPADVQPVPVATQEPVETPPPDTGKDPNRSTLNISDEIRRACGITDAEAYFGFDSANVRPSDRAVLRKLADCFTTGPLKGRQMRLVGHADPRGDYDYNMVLGGKRAENVKRVIATEGMEAGRIDTTSRGEMDATGTDEATWAQDRRVDVVLGD